MKEYKTDTILCHLGEDRHGNKGAVVPPIYQNSLFTFKNWDAIDKAFDDPVNNFIYTRGKNPSVAITEEKIAKIAGGEKAKLFSSGMGAITSSILHFIKSGDHIVTINNIYGPANNFINKYLKEKFNIEVTYISGKKVEEFEQSIKHNTKLFYLESPSSAIFSLQDLEAVSAIAKRYNINTVIDNTWATPLFQQPLKFGIDIEVHSCSKYIAGHSDIVAGVAIGKTKDIDKMFLNEHALFGSKISPFEAWLIMRSLRTFSLRMEKHQLNSMKVSEFLENHSKIRKVLYPGLKSFPQYELGKKQMSGYSGLLSFEIELGCTGGEEDGVDNTGMDSSALYTQPEDVCLAYERLSKISPAFTIAASFGNVHGVYKPGNVVLTPEILKNSQAYIQKKLGTGDKPVDFVFHGGSGSEPEKIEEAISYGVIKMNIDTDTQWATWKGVMDYYKKYEAYMQGQIGNPDGDDKPNKKYYDPRKWIRAGQDSMVERLKLAFKELNCLNRL